MNLNPPLYTELVQYLDNTGNMSPHFRRESRGGYVEYGNRALQPLKSVLGYRRSTLPDFRRSYLAREAEDLRNTGAGSYLDKAAGIFAV